MMVDLKVMPYFKISLSTRNWDRAFFISATTRQAHGVHAALPMACAVAREDG